MSQQRLKRLQRLEARKPRVFIPFDDAAAAALLQWHLDNFAAVDAGRKAESLAHAGISRVQHLLGANPLRESNAKLQRINGVIPLFRGENARFRGLDPANIRAFDLTHDLGLTAIDQDPTFQEPAEFARLKQDFSTLRNRRPERSEGPACEGPAST